MPLAHEPLFLFIFSFSFFKEQYNNLPVDVKVTQLLTALHTNTLKEEVRHMAAVVLRRLFASEFQDFYPNVSACIQLNITSKPSFDLLKK